MQKHLALIAVFLLSSTVAHARHESPGPHFGPFGRMHWTIQELEMPRASAPVRVTCGPQADAESLLVAAEYDSLYKNQKNAKWGEIGGVKLWGTPDQLKTFKRVLGEEPPTNWQSTVSGCSDVLCALQKIFGDWTTARRVLIVAKRNGYVITADQSVNATKDGKIEQIFRPGEVRAIERALSTVPQALNNLSSMDGFFRIADGYRQKSHQSSGNTTVDAFAEAQPSLLRAGITGRIVFYDSTFEKMRSDADLETRRSVLHELCHHYDYRELWGLNPEVLSSSKKFNWWRMGWQEAAGKQATWRRRDDVSFPTHYATSSIREDFADSCAEYMLLPEQLKLLSEERYEFLRDRVFGGQEFMTKRGSWGRVNTLVTEQNVCERAFVRCANALDITTHGEFHETTYKTEERTEARTIFQSVDYMLTSGCANAALDTATDFIAEQIQDEPEYCAQGGRPAVRSALFDICQDKMSALALSGGRQRIPAEQ